LVIPLLILSLRDQIKHGLMTRGFHGLLFAMFNAYMPLKRIGQVYQQFQLAQGATRRSLPISIGRRAERTAGRNLWRRLHGKSF